MAISLYNCTPSDVSALMPKSEAQSKVERRFPKGGFLRIANPFLKIGNDGGFLVRVDDPRDVVCVENGARRTELPERTPGDNYSSNQQCTVFEAVESSGSPSATSCPVLRTGSEKNVVPPASSRIERTVLQLKDLGNAEFKLKNYEAARTLYYEAINHTSVNHHFLLCLRADAEQELAVAGPGRCRWHHRSSALADAAAAVLLCGLERPATRERDKLGSPGTSWNIYTRALDELCLPRLAAAVRGGSHAGDNHADIFTLLDPTELEKAYENLLEELCDAIGTRMGEDPFERALAAQGRKTPSEEVLQFSFKQAKNLMEESEMARIAGRSIAAAELAGEALLVFNADDSPQRLAAVLANLALCCLKTGRTNEAMAVCFALSRFFIAKTRPSPAQLKLRNKGLARLVNAFVALGKFSWAERLAARCQEFNCFGDDALRRELAS